MAPSLDGYRRTWWTSDVLGGISAGAVVIPQAMAYATIADLPVQVGLYTCIGPMLVYALLGGSRAMSVSTTSTIATLTATTLVTAGVAASSDDALGSLITLTLLVGVTLLLARLLHLGTLVENISLATVLGVKIGVGATVAVAQLPAVLGETGNLVGHGFVRSLLSVGAALDTINTPTVWLSACSLAVLVLVGRYAPRVPGTLLVVLGGILLVSLTDLPDRGVLLIDPVPSGLPVPGLPDLEAVPGLLGGALAIALMVFLESAAVARGLRRPEEPPVDADQELLAVGAANVAGALFTAMPAAGGFSQSAVNQRAGARTQLASLVTVALALLTALFLGPVLSQLPQATLATLVLVSVVGLIDLPELARWSRVSPVDFWVAVCVAAVALSTGLLAAVAVGVVVTLGLVLHELNQPRLTTERPREDVLVVTVGQGLYTANVRGNTAAVEEIVAAAPDTQIVVMDLERVGVISLTVVDALAELDRQLSGHGVVLHVAGLPARARAVAERTEWHQQLAAQGRVHRTATEGVAAISARD
ncbi:MAG: SulP family inorganic anion transporter [Actinomycetales bacterium]|nr:SulP family inorganic anion transporter [Actinomycetales bacterium]